MTYSILIGQRSYSSWSLRGWLAFAAFDIPVSVQTTRIYSDHFLNDLAKWGDVTTVPVARTPEGGLLSDSLAIAWHLAETFPEKNLLPADPGQRARAMSLVAEMHTGYMGLRRACPMNLRTAWEGFVAPSEVLADLDKLNRRWSDTLAASGGPWLCGDYSLADAFFAPVATRLLTYQLPISEPMRAYAMAHVARPEFRQWRAMGAVEGPEVANYDMDLPRAPFPAPTPLPARAVKTGPSENALCPYSGTPVTDFLELDGRIFGFCNPFCRDKTVADPEAWPAFMRLVNGA